MDYNEFIEKQESIYNKSRDTREIKTEGLKPNEGAISPQRLYLIALRHSDEIAETIGAFSERISRCVPAMAYRKEVVHTTFSDYRPGKDEKEEDVRKGLCEAAFSIARKPSPSILYSEWLYNPNSVIIAGTPNEVFLNQGEQIKNAIDKSLLPQGLRPPWGAHITTSRFTEKRNAEELSDFFNLMKEAPLIGESNPKRLDVAIIGVDERRNFYFDTIESFELK